LTTIAEWTKFYEIFKGLTKVHHKVFDKAKILHRDINPGNLMVKVDANGRHDPFLIDFDFAKDMDKDPSDAHIKTHRTMSTPFLALELLSDPPPQALYRHDLESFVWCLWWIAVSYLNGEQIETHELDGWCNGTWIDIGIHKVGAMQLSVVRSKPLTINMEPARPILERLVSLFEEAYNWRSRQYGTQETVDRETAGQIITWETFQARLD